MSNEIKSVTGQNDDGTSWTLSVGDRVKVEATVYDEDSADEGKIMSFTDAETAVVYWDSGVQTPVAVADLTHE